MTEQRTTDGDIAALVDVFDEVGRRVAAENGVELVEVVVKGTTGRRIVRLVVDGDDGVDIDAIAAISRGVSAEMDDDEDLIAGTWTLEVTSPGVDRPLTERRHWQRNVGRDVHVVYAKAGKNKEVTGKLAQVDGDEVVVNAKGRMVTIALDAVERAKVVLPW